MRGTASDHAPRLGIIGREAYNLSAASGTSPTYLMGPLTTGVFFVIFTWRQAYQGMRDANILLDAVERDRVDGRAEGRGTWIR